MRKLAKELMLLEEGIDVMEAIEAVDVLVGKPVPERKLKSAVGSSLVCGRGPDDEGPICSQGSEPRPLRPMVEFHSRFFPVAVVDGGGIVEVDDEASSTMTNEDEASSTDAGGARLRG